MDVTKLNQPITDIPILPLNCGPAVPLSAQNRVVMNHWYCTHHHRSNSRHTAKRWRSTMCPTTSVPVPTSTMATWMATSWCAALTPNAGKDSCQGDWGGPIVTWNLNDLTDCSRFGVVSWCYGCGEPGFPGVYTSVSIPSPGGSTTCCAR